ncbi:hypothetical protein [Marinobacter nitratireducens]|uniref:hypothetical protein n=1 Tax=Marinobacter nitratireducens TaxID=1137280 RepID=UPI00056C7F40|nr:hypothetical protein [Marinobacter nitratireducens]
MHYLRKSLICAAMVVSFGASPMVGAQDSIEVEIPEGSVLSDGQLSKEELAHYAIVGQRQLVYLTEKAMEQYSSELLDEEPNMPAAWMLMMDGETVKRINIDSQVGDAPAQVRILMYRAALKSVARRGKINAVAILYTGKVKEGSNEEALVIEHEHRLGISGNKVIPYDLDKGKVNYSDAVTSEKPFQLFYDGKPNSGAIQG